MNPFYTIPSVRDGLSYTWLLWNTQRNLVSGDWAKIFHTDLIFWPIGSSLRYDIPFVNSLLSMPAYICCGPVFAYNYLVVFSFVFTLLGFFFFLRNVVQSQEGAWAGALSFTFSLYRLNRLANGHMDLISTQWVGFFLLFIYRIIYKKDNRFRTKVAAAIFLILQAYTDYRTFLMLGMIYGIIFLHYLITQKGRVNLRNYILQHFHVVTVLLIGIAPLIILHRNVTNIAYTHTSDDIWFILNTRTADLTRYFIPTYTVPVYGGIVTYLLTLWAVYIADRKKHIFRSIWTMIAVVFFLITMGFGVRIEGSEFMSLIPITWYERILNFPILRFLHVPNRFVFGVHIALAVGVAYAVSGIASRITSIRMKIVVLMSLYLSIILQNALYARYVTTPLTHTPITQYLSRQSTGAVLVLPHGYYDALRMRPGDEQVQERAMYLQMLHKRPIVGGYLSYIDDAVYSWHVQQPLLGVLAEGGMTYRDIVADDGNIGLLRERFGIRFLWIQDPACQNRTSEPMGYTDIVDDQHGECLVALD